MNKAVSDRIELLCVEDVAPDIVAEAAAAALATLDAIGVSPLQANASYSQLEVMDDRGDLDGRGADFQPPYDRYGVVPAHVDAYSAAIEAVLAVFRARGVGPRTGGVSIAVPESVWDEERRTGRDLSVA